MTDNLGKVVLPPGATCSRCDAPLYDDEPHTRIAVAHRVTTGAFPFSTWQDVALLCGPCSDDVEVDVEFAITQAVQHAHGPDSNR